MITMKSLTVVFLLSFRNIVFVCVLMQLHTMLSMKYRSRL